MIRKISGKNISSPINHLSKNHVKATNKKDIADLLAKTFSTNSSSDNYNEQFQNIKKKAEKTKLNFKSNNLEDYNLLPRKVSLKHLLIKNIIGHGSMVIVKLQSDHAKRLYENSIYIQLPIILIILKYIGQKHQRKHLGRTMLIG